MASPFSAFRKRQKTWMAVLGVMCMIVFVFGSAECMGPSGPVQQNPVVASTKYGDLHESDLAAMLQTQQLVNRFLSTLVYQSTLETFKDSKLPQEFMGRFLGMQENQLRSERLLLEETENNVIDTLILARKAEEMGVVVSDAAINDFIEQRKQKLSAQQVQDIVKELKISPTRLFDGLRKQLMAARMQTMFFHGLVATPPAQKWEYYLRLNRRARAEVIGVSVNDLVSQVKSPSDETLKEFFGKHEKTLRAPGSPDPGFKQPHQVATEYLRADYEKFLAMQTVTDEEVAAHYEKNKDTNYLFTEPPAEPAAKPDPKADDKPAAIEEKSDAAKLEATKPDDKKPADESKTSDEKKPDDKTPAAEKTEEKKPTDDKPAAKEPVDGAAKESKAEATKPGAAENKADDNPCNVQDEKPAPAQEVTDKQPEKAAAAEPNTVQPPETKDVAAAKTPAADSAGATAPAADTDAPSMLDLLSQLSLPRDIRDGPRPKHNPLWRVEDQIHRELKGQKATRQMQEILGKIKPVLDSFYSDWHASPDSPPKRPDFAALATAHGLSAHETGLMSLYRKITETELGQAIVQYSQSGEVRNRNYVEAVLKDSQLFKPTAVEDFAKNQFLFWKTKDAPEHVPTFEEARDQVVTTWKEIQARTLARERADELAALARKHGGSLKEALPESEQLKVVETVPFTWMTGGNNFMGPSEPRITTVPGIDSPGKDLMQTVFELQEGEVGVAMNEPQSVAYVVRLRSLEPSPTVLRETFAVETPQQAQTVNALVQEDRFEITRKWLEEMRESAGLHWKRPAHTVAMR